MAPVGTWSSRFAEGARVPLNSDEHEYRGAILPLLVLGHAYNEKCRSATCQLGTCGTTNR